jgi:hypothetical protein
MFKKVSNTVFVLFVGSILGAVTGFVITTIIGFVFIMILGGVYPSPTDFEELGANLLFSAIICGSFGVIVGFTTGVGVTLMGIRPHASLIWGLITGTSILLGGWIGEDKWLNQDIVRGNWYPLAFVAISSAIAVWLVARVIERILSTRLNGGKITPLAICGYVVAFALITLVTSGLLSLATSVFHY